jgi:ribose transport system ATP-binding protein
MKQVSKSYGAVRALREASLVCQQGEIHGLIGENGAGKSTLIKILSGAVKPDAGSVEVGGAALSQFHPGEARAQRIHTVFQELSSIEGLSVAQNLLFGIEPKVRLGRISRQELNRRAQEALDGLGVEQDATRQVESLRLDERQVLEVAKALVRDPRVLLLDEATSSLHPAQVEWLFERVREFAAGGGTAIFVSHRLDEITELCGRVTVFRSGTDVASGDTHAMPEERLIELMLGQSLETVYPPRTRPVREEVACRLTGFGVPPVLRKVDLTIRKGEIMGIAGLQGQGQADLFLSMYGALRSEGTMELDGEEVNVSSPARALELGVGLVPEDRARDGLFLTLPVADNMILSALPEVSRGGLLSRRRVLARVKSEVETLRIKVSNLGDEVDGLSGGNQQRVVLGRVLMRKPRLLLMYDATRGVDVGTKSAIYGLMRELSDSGIAILWYSSEVPELVNMSDRVAVLHDGAVSALLEDEITESSIIGAAVGGAGSLS